MSGEKSKEIGEYGEKVVSRLLKMIGWNFFQHPVEVPCHRSDLHKTPKGKPKANHGLDFLHYYSCPLCSDTQKTIAISVKYRDAYPSDSSSEVKKFISELGNTMHCLTLDKSKGMYKIDKCYQRIEHIGLLFYLTHNGTFTDSIIGQITAFRNTESIQYKPIYLIDNKMASFIYSAIKDVLPQFSDKIPKYAYSNTEQNIAGSDLIYAGKILPIEFITSGILPFQVEKADGKHLYLYVLSTFTKDNFESLFHFACKYTNGWASAITLKFQDYNELKHKNDVALILASHQNEKLAGLTNIESFTINDFRTLENN